MSDIDLRLADDEDWPPAPAPSIPGHVLVSGTVPDGVWRVAVVDTEIRLTIAGPDGMATLTLDQLNSNLIGNALNAAELDVSRIKRGGY